MAPGEKGQGHSTLKEAGHNQSLSTCGGLGGRINESRGSPVQLLRTQLSCASDLSPGSYYVTSGVMVNFMCDLSGPQTQILG